MNPRPHTLLMLFLLLSLLTACRPAPTATPTPSPSPTSPPSPTPEPTATFTPSPEPSPTPLPSPSPSPTLPGPTPTPRLTEQGVLPPAAVARLGKGVLHQAWWDSTGQRYLVLAGKSLYLYTADGQLQQVLLVPEGARWAGFLDDNRVLLAGESSTLAVLDLATQTTTPLTLPEGERPTALATNPALGQALVGTQTGRVYWLDETQNLRPLPQTPEAEVTAVVLSPRGSLAVAGYHDGTLLFWSLLTPDQPPLALRGHTDRILSLAFVPTATTPTLIASSADRQVLAWDLNARRQVQTYPIVDAAVSALDVYWQGTLLLGGTLTGDLLVWDLNNAVLGQRLAGYHRAAVAGVDLQPLGNLALTVGRDGQLTLFDLGLRTAARVDASYSLGVRSAALHPSQDLVALGTETGQIFLWNPTTGQRLRTLEAHQSEITSLAFSQDGQYLASVDLDGRVFVWDTARWVQAYYRFYGPGLFPVEDLTFAPDNTYLAGVGWTNLYIWDLETEENQFALVEGATLHSMAMHPSGRQLAVGTNDGRVLVWDVLLWGFTQRKTQVQGLVEALAYSPSGTRLAGVTSARQLYLWEQAEEPQAQLPTPFTPRDLLFLSEDRLLVAGDGWALLDVETQTWQPLPPGFGNALVEVHLWPDRQQVLTVAQDGNVLLWDLNALLP